MFLYEKSLVLIAAVLPSYVIRFSLFGIPTNLLEFLIWLTFLSGLLQLPVRHSWITASKTIPKPILFSVFIFLFSAVVSTAISPHLETSAGILKGWIITPMLYGFIVYASIGQRVLGIGHYVKALVLSGLVMALLGISQIGTLDRVQGIFDVPNSLALFLAPLIVLAFSSFRLRHSSFAGYASVVMFLALLFTQSLAGVFSVLIVMSLCFVFWKLKFVWALCFVICVLSATLVLLPKITYLMKPGSSAHVRLQLWSISWDLIKAHPLLGLGLGTFEPAYQQKLHERFAAGEAALPEFVFRDPHNWLLSFWLNTGLLGLISFVFLNGYALWKSMRSPIALALFTLLIFGLVDTVYWKNDLANLHWLLLALAISGIIKA